ncbi:hypothetical protein Sjap_021341 [Stephania japonica]|uniref:C2 domain-containing protein n=1 Tax=Stephania japonica TaxID=461633 RepID=A0AAP0EVN2_9MAGN
MAKLVVEALDASSLMPKDKHGSASAYVEVDFEGQRHRTQTKANDLCPSWNEKLVFNVSDPRRLPNETIEVAVYNDVQSTVHHHNHKSFLGRVRISGVSVCMESEAGIQRYPLEKRGIFSNISGDIALRLYTVYDSSFADTRTPSGDSVAEPPLQEIQNKNFKDDSMINNGKEKNKKGKEVRTFHSIGTAPVSGPIPMPIPTPAPIFPGFEFNSKENPVVLERRSDFSRMMQAPGMAMHGQIPAMYMQGPVQQEFGLIETRPPIAARLRYKTGHKISTTFDLVEPMYYLYVKVLKARNLPVMDVTGSLDPYVEVKLGNYKAVTRHFEKNQNPVWNHIFAFSFDHLQSNLVEVTLKDKDFVKDDFVGRLVFDILEVPLRVPPDSPLAPQWYRLEDKKGEKVNGEVMLAVWKGTQADECFPEAWLSDAHSIHQESLANTRSKVYFSPKLFYLRIHVIEAQDLVPFTRGRAPAMRVKVQLSNQVRLTKPFALPTVNPAWNEELMFVVPEPVDELIVFTVEDVGTKDEIIGRLILPASFAIPRLDNRLVNDRWFNLERPIFGTEDGDVATEKKKEPKFSSKIRLRLSLDVGYHVLDEATHYSSNLQPSAKHLRKPSIGILELGILSAKNLLPMKIKNGRSTDAYCVAKYGNKWVRTRTLLDNLAPRWNEQYTWEVYDPCTVITIGVFDNCHINGDKESKDQRIGKVRIRLSTLETERVYTHYYPLLVLQPSGLKKTGELQLALRFTCTAWVNMVSLYAKPLLPKMHYVQPIPIHYIDSLRHRAMQIVAARLARAEPPLRPETVEYMLDVDHHMWSLRRSKANFNRIMSVLAGLVAIGKWFEDICYWKNPVTTCLVYVLFLILVCYPDLILPTMFLYLFIIGICNYRFRPRHPPHMDPRVSHADRAHPDELDEEFDTFPSSRPADLVRIRYDRMRSVLGRMQAVAGDLATQGERFHAILNWRDPRATAIFIFLSLILASFLYVTPFQVVMLLAVLYLLRPPRFRSKMPSVPINFFKRLPAKSDVLL